MKRSAFMFPLFAFFLLPGILSAAALSFSPEEPIQGEPILITVTGTTTLADIASMTFGGSPLKPFSYQGRPAALYGIDINKKPGTYSVIAVLKDGTTLRKQTVVGMREKYEAPLGIPAKLGGNTEASAKKVVDTLALENATLVGLRTGDHAFWTEKFRYPLASTTVTDPYGYSRNTLSYTITHKGTDFRAAEGTKVMAMNRGVVRLVRTYTEYGKTVIVDHGLGLMTFYMHLSKILVNPGELVLPGQVIGLSGQTGYAEQPHLHLTVRINDISIDPIAFMGLFK